MCMMPRATPSAMCRWGTRRRCQEFLVLWESQRAVQNNGNVKSELQYLAVKNLQYVLSTVELFLVLFLFSWLLWWTNLLVLFLVRVASHWLRSALASALDSAKYVRCKGPAAVFHRLKTSSQRRRVMHVVSNILPGRDCRPQIDIPKRDRHIRTYARTLRE